MCWCCTAFGIAEHRGRPGKHGKLNAIEIGKSGGLHPAYTFAFVGIILSIFWLLGAGVHKRNATLSAQITLLRVQCHPAPGASGAAPLTRPFVSCPKTVSPRTLE